MPEPAKARRELRLYWLPSVRDGESALGASSRILDGLREEVGLLRAEYAKAYRQLLARHQRRNPELGSVRSGMLIGETPDAIRRRLSSASADFARRFGVTREAMAGMADRVQLSDCHVGLFLSVALQVGPSQTTIILVPLTPP